MKLALPLRSCEANAHFNVDIKVHFTEEDKKCEVIHSRDKTLNQATGSRAFWVGCMQGPVVTAS
jgi:hypothetical protein